MQITWQWINIRICMYFFLSVSPSRCSCYALKWNLLISTLWLSKLRGAFTGSVWNDIVMLRSVGPWIVCVRICRNCWHGRWLSEIPVPTRAMCYANLPAGMPTVIVTLQSKGFTTISSRWLKKDWIWILAFWNKVIPFDVRESPYFHLQAYTVADHSRTIQYNSTLLCVFFFN